VGALPKRKISKSRKGERRSHLARAVLALAHCPQCHSLKPSHRACPVCGTYAGREVLKLKSPKRREQ